MLDLIIGGAVLAALAGWVAALVRPATTGRAGGWLRRRGLEPTAPAVATVGEYLDRVRRCRIGLLVLAAVVLLAAALAAGGIQLAWVAAALLTVPPVAGVAASRRTARHPTGTGRLLAPAWLLHAQRGMAVLAVGGVLGGLTVAWRQACTLPGAQPLWLALAGGAALAGGGWAAAERLGGRADPAVASRAERAVARAGARTALGVALAATAVGLRQLAHTTYQVLTGCPATAAPGWLLTTLQHAAPTLAVVAAAALALLVLLPAREPRRRRRRRGSVDRPAAEPADAQHADHQGRRGKHRRRDRDVHVRDRLGQERGADPLAHVGEGVE